MDSLVGASPVASPNAGNTIPWEELVMRVLAIGPRLEGACWAGLIGLLVLGILLALPGQGAAQQSSSDLVNQLLFFQALVNLSVTPGTTLTVGDVNLLFFEFAIDIFLQGRVTDAELMQIVLTQININKQLGM
jgi:hypothetical protein